MDVSESSQGSSKDDKEGEVSSTCNDSRNNEEQTLAIEMACNSNNPSTPESSEPSSIQEGTSTKRSLSPDTSNALGGLVEETEIFQNECPVEAEQGRERVPEHRGHMTSGGSDSVPSVSSEITGPESNRQSERGNSEEILTSTTEDPVVAGVREDETVSISESAEELENRPSSAGLNNPQEDLISVSSATNVQNSDGAGNSISGLIDVQEEVDTEVDGNVPSLPGAADSTTLELMELSDDSSSSIGENFGVSTTAREIWQVSTTHSFHSNSETPSSECVPSAYSHSASASTSRVIESVLSIQRECQQSDTVSATENNEGTTVSTTIREISRPIVMRDRLAHPSNGESSGNNSDQLHSERSDSVSASVSFPAVDNREINRMVTEESTSATEHGSQDNPSLAHITTKKNIDSVSSSKDDCFAKIEEAFASTSNTSMNQESSIDTTTGVMIKSSLGTAHRRNAVQEGQSADLSSFSITTSNRDRNISSDSQPVSDGVEDAANTILRLIGLEDSDALSKRAQTDSRVSTSGQHSVKGGATSTTIVKSYSEGDKSFFGKSHASTSKAYVKLPVQPHNLAESNTQPNVDKEGCSGRQVFNDNVKDCDINAGEREDGDTRSCSKVNPQSNSKTEVQMSFNINLVSDSSKNPNAPTPCSENLSDSHSNTVLSQVENEIPCPLKVVILKNKSVHKNEVVEGTCTKTAPNVDSYIVSTPSCSSMSSSESLSKASAVQNLSSPSNSKSENKINTHGGALNEKKDKVNSAQPLDIQTGAIELGEEVISCEVVAEAFVRGVSETEWSEEAVLIGEEVSMSAVEEALFAGKNELDQFTSGISLESIESSSQVSVKAQSGPLKRFGSPPKHDCKKLKIQKDDISQPPCESSMRNTSHKSDLPSCSKSERTSPPRDKLEAILSAMEGSSVDMSSASCTPPLADPQNSNESGGDEVNMESIMADLLKSKMEAMDADSGSDDVQIIEVIEHPRKEAAELVDNIDQGVPIGERILVEIGEGGGIRVGPMQPSRGSIRTTRGLPGITVMRGGGVRGRGRGSRSVLGGRGNQVAMRRGIGRGTRGSGATRGRSSGDAVTSNVSRGMPSLRGMSTPSPRGMAVNSPRGMGISSPRGLSIVSPRGASSAKGISERGHSRGIGLGRPPGRGLGTNRGGRGGDVGRGSVLHGGRGRGAGVRGMGLGGGRGSGGLGRGIPSNLGRGLSITVGRGMVVERIPSSAGNGRGISKGLEIGIDRPGVVISASRGTGYGSGRFISRGTDVGVRGSAMVRGVGTGRGTGILRSGVRGSRGMGRGGGRASSRGSGRTRGSGGRGSSMGSISLTPEITLLPQDLKMPHVQLDVSVGSTMGSMPGISAVKREGLTIIPHGPLPSFVKEENSASHDVIVVAEVGGNGSVKVEQSSMERLVMMQDEKLNAPVTVEVKMENIMAEGSSTLLTKRKRKPRKPLELSPEITRPKRPRKAKTKSEDEPKPKKGKKGQKKGSIVKKENGDAKNSDDAHKNGGFTEKLPIPIDSHAKPTIQIFEEETRMSADSNSRSQTPARTLPSAALNPEEEASQGSLLSNGTTESAKKKVRLEVYDPDSNIEFTAENLAEYQWPLNDKNADQFMIQEQISEYLGVKSFKRKYPDLKRRAVEAEEKAYLRERGMVSESLCDLGLTAVNSSEVLDVMYTDFQEKYEEYRRVTRDRQAKEISNRQKAVSGEKNKQSDYKRRAMKSAASWNSSFNKERKEERRCCFDLQSFTIHYPKSKAKLMTREKPKIGHYPISLIPGQYTDYYKRYTPTELRYYPLNTVLYGPMRPNEMEEHASDGSQSESEDSSSSDDSSSSCSEGTQDTEETCSTADLETETTQGGGGVGDGCGRNGANSSGPTCKSCGGDHNRNKLGRSEPLIQCAQCESSGHPSCLDLTLDMVPHIKSYDWQCTDCKTCIECKDPADEDKMLFCDMCDRGYHIYCVGLRKVPSGSWHCQVCSALSHEPGSKEQIMENSSVPQWQTECCLWEVDGNSTVFNRTVWESDKSKKGERERPISQITPFPKVLLSKI